jgi:hypothetical protein
MPFQLGPVYDEYRYAPGANNDRIARNPTYNPGPVTGGPAQSSPTYPGGAMTGAPAPVDGFYLDPRAGFAQGQALDLPAPGSIGPGMASGYLGGGYYGSPSPEGDPFGDISRSLEAALLAMQNQLSEQQMAWLEESRRRQAELSALEEAKKKRRLLGSKGRAGNLLTAGSGITAQGAPVSKAVLY